MKSKQCLICNKEISFDSWKSNLKKNIRLSNRKDEWFEQSFILIKKCIDCKKKIATHRLDYTNHRTGGKFIKGNTKIIFLGGYNKKEYETSIMNVVDDMKCKGDL